MQSVPGEFIEILEHLHNEWQLRVYLMGLKYDKTRMSQLNCQCTEMRRMILERFGV
jgi:hypothetical protein